MEISHGILAYFPPDLEFFICKVWAAAQGVISRCNRSRFSPVFILTRIFLLREVSSLHWEVERQIYSLANTKQTPASSRSLNKLTLTDSTERYTKKKRLYKIENDSYLMIIQRFLLLPPHSFSCSNKLKSSSVSLTLQIHPFQKCFSKVLFNFFSGSASKSSVTQTECTHITSLKLNGMC